MIYTTYIYQFSIFYKSPLIYERTQTQNNQQIGDGCIINLHGEHNDRYLGCVIHWALTSQTYLNPRPRHTYCIPVGWWHCCGQRGTILCEVFDKNSINFTEALS